MLAKGGLLLTRMAGVGGNNTTHYLARLQADVLSQSGQLVINYIGVNDFSTTNPVPFEQTKANLIEIWALERAAGKIPLQCLVSPVNSATLPQFAARAAEIPLLNAWIVNYARANPWLLVADTYSRSVDPTSTLGFPKADDVVDGLHKSAFGAYRDGFAIDETISRLLPTASVGRVSSNLDSRASLATSLQFVTNPMFLGAGGTKTPGAGTITGDVPDGWTVQNITAAATPEIVLSFVAPKSGVGRGLRIQITSVSAAEIAINSNAMAALVATGDIFDGMCDLEITTLTNARVNFQNRRNIGGSNVDVNAMAAGTVQPGLVGLDLHPKLSMSPVQSGAIALFSVRLFLQISAGAVVDLVFSRPEFRKVN